MTMVMVTVMTAREDKGDDDIYGHVHGHEYYGNGGADGDMMMMVLTRCGGGSDGGGGDGDAGVAMGCQIHMYSCHYAFCDTELCSHCPCSSTTSLHYSWIYKKTDHSLHSTNPSWGLIYNLNSTGSTYYWTP